jgi:hypothetical protein
LSNRRFSTKSIFTCCSILTDFCHYLHLPLDLFIFEFFWSEMVLEEVAIVANVLMLYLSWNWTKSGSTILHKLTLLMRIVWSFVWRKFSSVGKGEWWDEGWTKDQDWESPCHPKKYLRSTSVKAWGCPWHPFFINKNIRSSFKTLYFYCFICYVFFLERFYFFFKFSFLLFAVINGWTLTYFFWRRYTPFSLPRTL